MIKITGHQMPTKNTFVQSDVLLKYLPGELREFLGKGGQGFGRTSEIIWRKGGFKMSSGASLSQSQNNTGEIRFDIPNTRSRKKYDTSIFR